MKLFSTQIAAKKLGITAAALSKYIRAEKVPGPKIVQVGTRRVVHAWTEQDIERIRKILPKIINGRKTRYKKKKKK